MSGYPVTVTIGGVTADPCRVALPLTITHGRSAVASQPDAPSCTFTVIGSTPPGKVGDPLNIDAMTQFTPATYDDPTATYDDPSAAYDSTASGDTPRARFRGVIASLKAVEAGGQVTAWNVEGVGHQARLGYLQVTLTRPVETDVARIQALAAAAGVAVTVVGVAGVRMAAGVVSGDPLAAMLDVCTSSGGVLWQAPDGKLMYGTATHRGRDPVGVLDCEIVGDEVDWAEAMESIVNRVTITWGPEDGRGESTFTHDASATEPWGIRAVTADTQCADETDAEQLGLLIMARRAYPYWSTPAAMLYGALMRPADTRLLSALDVGTSLLVPIPSAPGATPADLRAATVEGWVEEWNTSGHDAQVALSDTARWVGITTRTYTEMLAAGTYAYWKTGNYLSLLVKGGS